MKPKSPSGDPRSISRQREWQKDRVAHGRCQVCGKKRPSDLKILCRRCQDDANDRAALLYHQKKAG
jgi:hypothetical protein